ncbi:hypothetical protein KC973_01470 [Candidatus Saccharibacteria bacterium]|nr:hypothetical protein [Candidatus Saccharibacteria bacterium]
MENLRQNEEIPKLYRDGDGPDVVITAGGTREMIDDVRSISNISTGALGAALAEYYYRRGNKVLLLAPQPVFNMCPTLSHEETWGVTRGRFEAFESAADLRRLLLGVSSARLVLHAAAVSDYIPVKVDGKIPSDEEEITLRLKRAPKILAELRDHFGDDATIVGFKLLSGASEEELIRAGTDQISKNQTDYCIANDLSERGSRLPPRSKRVAHVVYPDGSHDTVRTGEFEQGVARFIAETIDI